MGSAYLDSGELAAYGVSGASAKDIASASVLIDAAISRPEGLVWSPDADGWPCYMTALDPTIVFALAGAITPGQNVVVGLTGGMVTPDLVGDVVILDRENAQAVEACVVAAVSGSNVTLEAVKFAHAHQATAEQGLVITEERALPANRNVTQLPRRPVARLVSAQGRYSYGRRSQQQAGVFTEPSLLASFMAFGGVPVWNHVPVGDISVSPKTGEIWVPPGIMVATFSDVRLRYVAGYAAANLPEAVKTACAAVLKQMQNFPELSGSIQSFAAGGTKVSRFADTLLDTETKQRLAKFEALTFC